MTERPIITHYLSTQEVTILAQLLGRKFPRMFSPILEVKWPEVMAYGLVIPLGLETFIVIENTWRETELESLDYGLLSVNEQKQPEILRWVNHEQLGPLPWSPCSLFPFWGRLPTPVTSVRIYEREWAGEKERVIFDGAIAFHFQDGSAFLLEPYLSPVNMLVYTSSPEEVEARTGRLRERVVLK